MALALANPNDRRRINRLARRLYEGDFASAADAVQTWMAEKDKPVSSRDPRLQRRPDPELINLPKAERLKVYAARKAAAKDPKVKAAQREKAKTLARLRRAIAKEFEKQDPDGYKPTTRHMFGRASTRSYASRALGTHASRYYSKSKTKLVDRKGGGQWKVVDRDWINAHNQLSRMAARKKGTYGPIPEEDRYGNKNVRGGKPRGHRVPWATDKESQPYPMVPHDAVSKKAAALRKKRLESARSNGLALTNPRVVSGFMPFITGYALPLGLAGGAAGGIHAALGASGVTSKISDGLEKIPGVGEALSTRFTYSTQGLLFGTAAAALIGALGTAAGSSGVSFSKAAAAVATSSIVTGFGIDMFSWVTMKAETAADQEAEDELDLVLEGDDLAGLALGGIGYEALGGLAMGDGFAAQTVSLSGAQDYGQASLADATYSGADFSPKEGQALLNGRDSFLGCFGAPPYRMSTYVAQEPSHLAKREGHRWGWLIKMVGWDEARRICALAPKKRVAVLRRLRAAAIEASKKQAQAVAKIPESKTPAVVSGTPAQGATGARTNYLGDPALFMGA